MIFALFIAAVIGAVVYSDANSLGARGLRVGNTSPGGWGMGAFLLAIVFVPVYLIKRSEATTARLAVHAPAAGAAGGYCTTCGTPLVAGARYCGTCGTDRGAW
ncbi:MAG: zinc-ribbon domain-containing protein [Acidimicrobiales bacterium]